jgi:hypothetical protein
MACIYHSCMSRLFWLLRLAIKAFFFLRLVFGNVARLGGEALGIGAASGPASRWEAIVDYIDWAALLSIPSTA